MTNAIIAADKCCKRCSHRLAWADLPNGKRTQVQECRTAKYRAQSIAARDALMNAEIPGDLLKLIATL